jgi:hypothetical protein
MRNMRNEFGSEKGSTFTRDFMHQAKAQGSTVHPRFKGIKLHVEHNSGEVKRKPANGAFGKPKKKEINT